VGSVRGTLLLEPGIRSADDLRRLQPLDVRQGAYGEQLAALPLIARGLKDEAPFLQTVFSPLAVISRTTGSTRFVQRMMREEPNALLSALGVVAQTLAAYAEACVEAGAAGIFFATVEWGGADVIPAEDYKRFARPYDVQVLESVRQAPFNVLHVCRNQNHLSRLLDYPVAAFHWEARGEGNPSLGEIAARTERAVMGGVSQDAPLRASAAEVAAQAREAIEETGGRRFLLAPGCSIDPASPEANLRALAESPSREGRR